MLMLGIVGLPIPDETLLAGVGWYMHMSHRLTFFPSVLVAFFGSITGITLSFVIGKLGGRLLILRYGKYIHFTEERLTKVEKLLEKYGKLAIFLGYFLPGVRHVTAAAAGFGQMKYRSFWLSAYLGALVWVLTFITLGNAFGAHLHHFNVHRIARWLHTYSRGLAIAAIGLFVLVLLVNAVMRKRRADRIDRPGEENTK
ncbi:MAG: hypothetical protein JWN30_1856 [Bacilli bacterium]|nr:hypothetical protein [Bacilli bacterium]